MDTCHSSAPNVNANAVAEVPATRDCPAQPTVTSDCAGMLSGPAYASRRIADSRSFVPAPQPEMQPMNFAMGTSIGCTLPAATT